MSFSKSLFTNAVVVSNTRSVMNPVSVGGSGGGTSDLAVITASYYNTLKMIEALYGSNMANKNYEKIPNDFNKYVQFYVIIKEIQTKTKNASLLILLKLAQEALVGAINTYTIYGDNVVLRLDKTFLERKVDDILSNKNQKLVEIANSSGQLTITKTFKLAPVFNYYIMIYGMPAFGVGFDPAKINYLVSILKNRGINPYK